MATTQLPPKRDLLTVMADQLAMCPLVLEYVESFCMLKLRGFVVLTLTKDELQELAEKSGSTRFKNDVEQFIKDHPNFK